MDRGQRDLEPADPPGVPDLRGELDPLPAGRRARVEVPVGRDRQELHPQRVEQRHGLLQAHGQVDRLGELAADESGSVRAQG